MYKHSFPNSSLMIVKASAFFTAVDDYNIERGIDEIE
jgi:hypothetical protein